MQRPAKILWAISIMATISGCTSPAGYRYKFSPYEPATSSLWDSYSTGLSHEWAATTNTISSGIQTNFTVIDPVF